VNRRVGLSIALGCFVAAAAVLWAGLAHADGMVSGGLKSVTATGSPVVSNVNVATGGCVYMNGQGGSDNFCDQSGALNFAAATKHQGGLYTNLVVSYNSSAVGIVGEAGTSGPAVQSRSVPTLTAGFIHQFFPDNGTNLAAGVNWQGLFTTFGTAPRRQGSYQINLSADTTFTAIGLPAPSALTGGGTCTPAADTSNSAYQMIKYPTDGTVTHACGFTGPYTTAIEPTYLPLFYVVVKSDPSAVTNTRVYIGLTKSDLSAVSTLAGANTINGCFFRFDSGIGDTDLMAESSDGTTASASDTSISYAAATTYVLAIDNSVSGECDFYVNGVKKVAKASNITATGQALGLEAGITNITSGAVRALSVSKVILQQN